MSDSRYRKLLFKIRTFTPRHFHSFAHLIDYFFFREAERIYAFLIRVRKQREKSDFNLEKRDEKRPLIFHRCKDVDVWPLPPPRAKFIGTHSLRFVFSALRSFPSESLVFVSEVVHSSGARSHG